MSITARLRRLEGRQPPAVPAPAPLTDEERARRWEALIARVIDPDTGAVNPHANPDLLARWRRIEELFAQAEARRAAQEQGR